MSKHMSNSIAGPACKFRRPGKWTRGQNQWLSDEYTRPSDPGIGHILRGDVYCLPPGAGAWEMTQPRRQRLNAERMLAEHMWRYRTP
ncbi:hypothetical protein ACE6H2_003436 [Prunus campanulata]